MSAPVCYHYDPTCGAYVGTSEADPSPLEEGVWLFPAHTTSIAPSSVAEKQVAVFVSGAWTIEPDHRGETWWKAYGEPLTVATPGDPTLYGLLAAEPEPPAPPAPEPAPAPTLPELVQRLSYAAADAAQQILNQVAPDQPHLVAYQNAAAVVAGNSGNPPTTDPLMSAFNAQASAFGYTPQEFATMATSVSAASMTLSANLAVLQANSQKVTSADQLGPVLQTYESALTSLVAALNSANLRVAVVAPPAISIAGINA